MEIETINWRQYLIKKYARYLYLFLFILSICFPFIPPHSSANLIDNFHLPDSFYPIAYVSAFVFFILLISKFSTPKLKISSLTIDKAKKTLSYSNSESFKLAGIEYELTMRNLDEIHGRMIWQMEIKKPIHRTFNLLLDTDDRIELEQLLNELESE